QQFWDRKQRPLTEEPVLVSKDEDFYFLSPLTRCASLERATETTERSGEIVLKFDFHSYYDSYKKSCSKLFPRHVNVMDNRGFVDGFLRGRLTVLERSGSIGFRIANAQSTDGGDYRCYVDGTQDVYKDFTVEISEPSRRPPVRQTSTVKPQSTSTAPPTLRPGSGLPPYCNCGPFGPWTVNVLLITGASIATIALAGCVTAVVVCCRRKKSKRPRLRNLLSSAV
ncbi:hypothetical protein NHX12_017487, partial [Muraenolepis orangiensis]